MLVLYDQSGLNQLCVMPCMGAHVRDRHLEIPEKSSKAALLVCGGEHEAADQVIQRLHP